MFLNSIPALKNRIFLLYMHIMNIIHIWTNLDDKNDKYNSEKIQYKYITLLINLFITYLIKSNK